MTEIATMGYRYAWKDNCHKPKFVQVGESQVYLCGWRDCFSKEEKIIATLDLFVALDDIWDKLMPKCYCGSNALVQKFMARGEKGLRSLAIRKIGDSETDEEVAGEIVSMLRKGIRLGFGCLGGHGRTGWLLGCLIREMEGLKGDALLSAVRDRWCKDAIESLVQFESLGIDKKHWKSTTLAFGYNYYKGGEDNVI